MPTKVSSSSSPSGTPKKRAIILKNVRQNNLKNISLEIPLKQFTIVTGISGSGKSSLVFDTLYAEGSRRYIESLSTYTRQFLDKMPKPDLDGLENVPPAIALEQKNTINNSRSTVATMSELHDYLRIMFAKVGRTFCPSCENEVTSHSSQWVEKAISALPKNTKLYICAKLDLNLFKGDFFSTTKKRLVAEGYERLLVIRSNEDVLVDVAETTETFFANDDVVGLVIDRLATPSEAGRLFDALDQAFSQGNGEIFVAQVPGASDELTRFKVTPYSKHFRCDVCQINFQRPEPQHFSFNSAAGACSACSGFGYTLQLDEDLIVPDKRKTIRAGAIDPFTKPASAEWKKDMFAFCNEHKISLDVPYEHLPKEHKHLLFNGAPQPKSKSKKSAGFQGILACFAELESYRYKIYIRVFVRRYQSQRLCQVCKGSRLNAQGLNVHLVDTKTNLRYRISSVLELSVEKAKVFFQNLHLGKQAEQAAKEALNQIKHRLHFLDNVGVGYLTLDRLSKTLSGGECQRISLATQLGNKLCSTLYVLDEPSIGLHPADTQKLIKLLLELRDNGNTLVVVEHDLEVIRAADHIVEIGPFAGKRGGQVVAAGALKTILSDDKCLTAKYLNRSALIELPKKFREPNDRVIKIEGACEHNLKDVTATFPLNTLIAVSGLSGSGKTTLIHKTLYAALHRLLHRENIEVGRFNRLYGADYLRDVVLLDQKPISRSGRSNAATYLKIYDDIRTIMANQGAAIRRNLTPKHFSFNVDGGRCPNCKGEGEITLDMHFMSDLKLPCETCDGKKFTKKVLEVEFKSKNIDQILHTTVEESLELFREYPRITSKLQILRNVGLGYLELGQSAGTLSGGESQRLKIAGILNDGARTGVLYIFDEPTTGLHIDDVKKLLQVLHDLVDRKNTVIVVEHNVDVIANADWVVDMGPGGGIHGGEVIYCGPSAGLYNHPTSLTAQHLPERPTTTSQSIVTDTPG